MSATPEQLRARHDVKTARAATLLAVSELSRRILMERARRHSAQLARRGAIRRRCR